MNVEHLWTVDLNLLVVLAVLLEERSVTRTAARLGRTQSAISHALGRLRALFGDELFVRDGRRMAPTERADALAETLPRLLGQIEQTLQAPTPFLASESGRTFRLAAPDFVGGVLPSLLARIRSEAPGVRVELVPPSPTAARDVGEGRYDGLVGPAGLGLDGLRETELGGSAWTVFSRPDHPWLATATTEAWSEYPHLQVRTTGRGDGPVDRAARAAGVVRSVGALVPHFVLAPAVLLGTDLLLTVPAIATLGAVRGSEMATANPPFPIPPMDLALYRSARMGAEAGVAWFLDHVAAALAEALK